MSIIILNWAKGENDPFTYFSDRLKRSFEQIGRTTRIIGIDEQMVTNLFDAHGKGTGIEFIFTWQGLGSQLTSIWSELKAPLLCYHGDHPCYQIENHSPASPWVRHIYAVPSFALFANTHIPRKKEATYFPTPMLFDDKVKGNFSGDYFVLPKNIDDNRSTVGAWRNMPERHLSRFLIEAAGAVISEFRSGNHTNHHDVIESLLTPDLLSNLQHELRSDSHGAVRMLLHFLLDPIHRNAISESILHELSDIPLKIYGRGWDRFKAIGNGNHEFLNFNAVSDNSFQFASNYGIVDVAPICDSLHDRTLRAMGNQSGFLMGSDWPQVSLLGEDFSDVFFDGSLGTLRNKAEQVLASPRAHRQRCQEFALRYHAQFSVFNFVKYLESVGQAAH